jgi:hypothetical protein
MKVAGILAAQGRVNIPLHQDTMISREETARVAMFFYIQEREHKRSRLDSSNGS